MRKISPLSILWVILGLSLVGGQIHAQNYLRGAYLRSEVSFEGADMVVYTFSRKKNSQGKVKAKYFAKNANDQFDNWRSNKRILFYCSGAFSESWDPNGRPIGITVDNGTVVNRNLVQTMDGLVIVYNGGAQAGGIAVVNIEKECVNVNQGGKAKYCLSEYQDRGPFLRWAESQSATVFQTQLMYTKSYGRGFPTHRLTYGDQAERRFLAICMKKGVVYHIVIDHPESDYLNRSADKVIRYLSENLGYEIYGLFNLDTGGKNIMRAYDDKKNRIDGTSQDVDDATNLLVYYVE